MYRRLPLAFLTLVVALFAISSFTGCKKNDVTEEEIQAIADDLFPLTVGREIKFSGFVRDKTADTNITATGSVYEGKMFVASNAAATPVGGTSHMILDTSTVPTGVANPPTTKVGTVFFVRKPSSTGPYEFLTNIGRFYRTFGLQRADSLRWVILVRQDQGVNREWTAFDSSWTTSTGTVRLEVVGKVEGREQLTLAGQSFNAYKVQATRKVYLGGSATPSVQSPTATIWLEPSIGIVKFIFNSDGETPGFFREYKSRNF